MRIQNITDAAFSTYGRVLTTEYQVAELVEEMQTTDAPVDGVVYYPSITQLEALPVAKSIQDSLFGGLPIQIGYCNGTNYKLNAVEYHRSSEIGVAVTDLILLLGRQQDIGTDNTYDTGKIEAFLVSAGEVIELYATTLHYAPCSVDGKPFRNVVILPKGTNTELEHIPDSASEDKLLVAKNKWLIGHTEAAIDGAYQGLIGENVSVLEKHVQL
ncbi:MAG: DUF4867 family protein [Lachnospiraceae bacterium]